MVWKGSVMEVGEESRAVYIGQEPVQPTRNIFKSRRLCVESHGVIELPEMPITLRGVDSSRILL